MYHSCLKFRSSIELLVSHLHKVVAIRLKLKYLIDLNVELKQCQVLKVHQRRGLQLHLSNLTILVHFKQKV